MLFQRWLRRVKGFFGDITYKVRRKILSLIFQFILKTKGIDEAYLMEVFCFFADLSMKEPMFVGDLSVYGCGYYVELKNEKFHYTAQWSPASNQLVVFEWRKEPRKIKLEHDFETETNWHEIYRSKHSADYGALIKFVNVLKNLYGPKGKNREWESK